MAEVIKRHWVSGADPVCRGRTAAPANHQAYLPDSLVDREVVLDGRVAADVSEAEAALARFSLEVGALADSEALARLLLRTESVASSRIEGLEIGARRLLRADAEAHGSAHRLAT